ncbi:MAG: UDP-3-O-(3-hydroxymyristoyl)glucosamine N-acyltransferase [Candidatus Aegiribacteria sp.]|nr:UDP-3-O-(3-hydroxymyristoyl)glucosamine N-acyltransferase [Candidatus Aegiribacteria sp.]
MLLPVPFSLFELKQKHPGISIHGSVPDTISNAALIPFANSEDTVFLDKEYWLESVLRSEAKVIILTSQLWDLIPSNRIGQRCYIISSSPFSVFNTILYPSLLKRNEEYASKMQKSMKHYSNCNISKECWISKDTCIGGGTTIYPYVFIGPGVSIGENSVIHSGSRILRNTQIACDVVIGANTVIGKDPFFYHRTTNDRPVQFPALGGVQIHDKANIGACCCIDRGVLEDTVVYGGVAIDNQVQIGHGSVIGNNTIIAAQTGIAGHVKIGNDVYIEGQVGIAPNVRIAGKASIRGRSVVSRSILESGDYAGVRALPIMREASRQLVVTKLEPLVNDIQSFFAKPIDDLSCRLKQMISDKLGVPVEDINNNSHFSLDMGVDSLDIVEFWMGVEDEFGIILDKKEQTSIHTFGDAMKTILRAYTDISDH